MVDEFEGCEFWLPPEFLKDDDDEFEEAEAKKKSISRTNSEMSSLGDSVLSSTESESDEDEFLTTHKIPNSTLQQSNKGLKLSSSPKSPLCKASEEFARRKMVEESKGISAMEHPGLKFGGFHPHQLSYQQLQAVRQLQMQEFRRRQMMNQNQIHQNMPMGLPVSAWPPLQRPQPKPQHGTGMRPVFLGANPGGAKKQCAGTGVFLPRTVPPTGNRKNKPACPPVLIPERVAQALNLNMDTLGGQNEAHRRPGYYNHNGTGLKFNNEKKNHVMEQRQKNNAKAEPENQEVIKLPPEWIY